MTPAQLVRTWVDCFNARDTDGLADLYHDDAVNHQVMHDPIVGRGAIRAVFEREFAAAANRVCIIEAVREADDVAALEWRGPLAGLGGCGFLTVRDGRIAFRRGDWDKLAFLRMHNLPIE